MGDLGDGTGSSYPAALDTDTNQEVDSPSASKTKARADVPNDLAAAVIAVQTELGIDPAGSLTDVVTYLQTEHAVDGTHSTVTGTLTPDVLTLAGSAWPSFSVNRNGSGQTNITSADKIEWTTAEFDTNSDFDVITNYRFIPTVAGKYLLTVAVLWTSVIAGDNLTTAIRKNNVEYAIVAEGYNTATEFRQMVTTIVDANGSTDYFEVFCDNVDRNTSTINGQTLQTFFCGSRIA